MSSPAISPATDPVRMPRRGERRTSTWPLPPPTEPRAIAAVEQLYLTQVGTFIAHLRPAESVVDEVRQRLRERLLMGGRDQRPKLLDYSGRGTLGGFIRVSAIRMALDVIEAEEARHRPEPPEDNLLAQTVDPELFAIHKRHLPQLHEAFRGALTSLDARERNLMRFFLVDGLNIARIGKLIGKSRATVGRMVVDCRAKLLSETRRRFSLLTGAPEADAASLIRFLRSRLEVSIRGFLAHDCRSSGVPEL
jgi:RNA polymerase sigma-70 factor (ECF subfamily)